MQNIKLLTNSVSKGKRGKKKILFLFKLGIKYYRFDSGKFVFPSLQSPIMGGAWN